MCKQKVRACADPLHWSEREREREREREKEIKKDGERESEKEGESSSLTRNKFFNCPELKFLFLKGMAGALAPFSSLVYNKARLR